MSHRDHFRLEVKILRIRYHYLVISLLFKDLNAIQISLFLKKDFFYARISSEKSQELHNCRMTTIRNNKRIGYRIHNVELEKNEKMDHIP